MTLKEIIKSAGLLTVIGVSITWGFASCISKKPEITNYTNPGNIVIPVYPHKDNEVPGLKLLPNQEPEEKPQYQIPENKFPETPKVRYAGLEENVDNSSRDILNLFLGKPYGPKFPSGKDKGKEMYDCVGLIYGYAKKVGRKITGSRGDQIYARHTKPVAVLSSDNHSLEGIKSGDLIFIGHEYPQGEGGISAYHLGIVGKVEYDKNGNPVNATMVHASGKYWNNRKNYSGEVKEVDLVSYLDKFKNNSKRNHMFIGRLN